MKQNKKKQTIRSIYTGLFTSQLLQSLVLNYDKATLHVDSYINTCLASYLDLNYLFCATIHDNHKIHQCVCVWLEGIL